MSYILGRVPLPGHPSWIESLAAVRFNRESATLEDSCWFPQLRAATGSLRLWSQVSWWFHAAHSTTTGN